MPRKGKVPMTPAKILAKIHDAGISKLDVISCKQSVDYKELESLSQRMLHVLSLTKMNLNRHPTDMLFFVMYDIESNKVRALVAKYLIRQGCFRIQRSLYLADMPADRCEQIKSDLAEVQAAYDNKDSILIVPISTDYLRSMKIIGKLLNVDIIMKSQNTLFF